MIERILLPHLSHRIAFDYDEDVRIVTLVCVECSIELAEWDQYD